MSLLMDALKRAETSKQEAARQPGKLLSEDSDYLRLEPISPEPARGGGNPLPDLASHLEAVDADLASAAVPPARPAASQARSAPPAKPSEPAEPREAVRNAFAAKQAGEPPSRLPLWLALGTLGLAGIGIGGYVWYQMNAMNRGTLAVDAPAQRPALPAAPTAPAIPLNPPAVLASIDRSTAAIAPAAPARPLFPRQEPSPAHATATEADRSSNTPIRLVRTRPEPDANLMRGHASLQRGEIDLSRRQFEQALQRDPNNTDVLLALAAIAQRQGRTADADSLRQRALVANPSDAATQAASLSSAAAEADPNTAESRLKSLLSNQPESAALNFALGNLYSRQGRWAEAQQVYFNAVAAEGDNPDYLFNLAVSLDHLRQSRLAAQHYRLALEASTKRPAAFDRDKIQTRLGELQPERQP